MNLLSRKMNLTKFKNDFLDNEVTGPLVDKDLADLFHSIKNPGMSKEKISSKAKKHLRPENCKFEIG